MKVLSKTLPFIKYNPKIKHDFKKIASLLVENKDKISLSDQINTKNELIHKEVFKFVKNNFISSDFYQPNYLNAIAKDTKNSNSLGLKDHQLAQLNQLSQIEQLAHLNQLNELGLLNQNATNVEQQAEKLKDITQINQLNYSKSFHFIPSANHNNEFVNLIGLEQVVNSLKISNAEKTNHENLGHDKLDNAEDWVIKKEFNLGSCFECSKCGTDFTCQWYSVRRLDKSKNESKNNQSPCKSSSKSENLKNELDSNDCDKNSPVNLTKNPEILCKNCLIQFETTHKLSKHKKILTETFNKINNYEAEMNNLFNEQYSKQERILNEKKLLEEKQLLKLKLEKEEREKQYYLSQSQQQELNLLAQQTSSNQQQSTSNSNGMQIQNHNSSNLSQFFQNSSTSNQNNTKNSSSSSISAQHIELINQILNSIQNNEMLKNAQPEDIEKIVKVLVDQLRSTGVLNSELEEIKVILTTHLNNMQLEMRKKDEKEKQKNLLKQLKKEQERKEAEKQLKLQQQLLNSNTGMNAINTNSLNLSSNTGTSQGSSLQGNNNHITDSNTNNTAAILQSLQNQPTSSSQNHSNSNDQTDDMIQQVLNLIFTTQDTEQQNHLLQMLLSHTSNNPEIQQKIVSVVMKMAENK